MVGTTLTGLRRTLTTAALASMPPRAAPGSQGKGRVWTSAIGITLTGLRRTLTTAALASLPPRAAPGGSGSSTGCPNSGGSARAGKFCPVKGGPGCCASRHTA